MAYLKVTPNKVQDTKQTAADRAALIGGWPAAKM